MGTNIQLTLGIGVEGVADISCRVRTIMDSGLSRLDQVFTNRFLWHSSQTPRLLVQTPEAGSALLLRL